MAMPKLLQCDAKEIERALRLLIDPGACLETRLLKCHRGESARPFTAAGYFDDAKTAVEAVVEWDRRHQPDGSYVTLNPVDPRLHARSPNRITSYLEPQTGDAEIVRRTLTLIDCDPVRPTGISATDREVASSLERASVVRNHLTEQGWPSPVLACSGNGYHLLYQTDLPNDDQSKRLMKRLLERLDTRFSVSAVKIDTTVSNAGRITKLYGTVARKGAYTEDRPHRLSRIMEVPDSWLS
jgi:hypothetical protein